MDSDHTFLLSESNIESASDHEESISGECENQLGEVNPSTLDWVIFHKGKELERQSLCDKESKLKSEESKNQSETNEEPEYQSESNKESEYQSESNEESKYQSESNKELDYQSENHLGEVNTSGIDWFIFYEGRELARQSPCDKESKLKSEESQNQSETNEEPKYQNETNKEPEYQNDIDEEYASSESDHESEFEESLIVKTPIIEVYTIEDVTHYELALVAEISELLELPSDIARIMLNHFKWDKEELTNYYFAAGPDEVFKEIKVVNPFTIGEREKSKEESDLTLSSEPGIVQNARECEICLDATSKMYALDCGHEFCVECWREHVEEKIKLGVALNISCAASGCPILVGDSVVTELVKNKRIIGIYRKITINRFVECNRQLRWCPSEACGRVIRMISQYSLKTQAVTCACGDTFCFNCGESWHEPINCYLLNIWKERFAVEIQSNYWINTLVKNCPNCKVRIEKVDGCAQMHCTYCNTYFCWDCLKGWGYHACNVAYDTEEENVDRDKANKIKRLAIFWEQYVSQVTISTREKKLRAFLEEDANKLFAEGDVQFMINAAQAVKDGRQVLKYAIVLMYFLEDNQSSLIFEAIVKELEYAVESLSTFLRAEVTKPSRSRYKVEELMGVGKDKYFICKQRLKVLLTYAREASENDSWKYMGK